MIRNISKIEIIRKIACLTLSFIVALIFIRAEILGVGLKFSSTPLGTIKDAIYLSFEDVWFAIGLATAFAVIALLVGSGRNSVTIVWRTFVFFVILCIIWSVVNVYVVQILNVPINFQLIYYGDFLGSDYLIKLIVEYVTWAIAAKILTLNAIVLVLGYLFYYTSNKVRLQNSLKYSLIGFSLVCLLVYSFIGNRYVTKMKLLFPTSYGKIANPELAFVKSFALAFRGELSFIKAAASNVNDPVTIKERSALRVSHAPLDTNVKNVIFFIMESVPAQYLAGAEYRFTPELRQHLGEAMVFNNIYAHSPNSVNSLFSILSSLYPQLSYKNIVSEHPNIQLPTLSSELKKRNYKTSFFGFSDNTYMNVGKFLSYHSFDKIRDHKQMPCKIGSFTSDAEGADNGKDDECMLDEFVSWLSADVGKQPFFSMLWTMQTHWPYFVSGSEKSYGVSDTIFNHYLNALNHTDAVLGKLLDSLKQKGLSQSTLVVVTGDHGEAFGQRGQYGHGSNIYEENVHVPLILINPLLFNGEEKSVIGGYVDVPATVMDILGNKKPEIWQGTSLFDTTRSKNTYFFSTWSDYLFGYRNSDYKVIHSIFDNRTTIYNLNKDPLERENLSDKMPQLVDGGQTVLRQWVQSNQAFMRDLQRKSQQSLKARQVSGDGH